MSSLQITISTYEHGDHTVKIAGFIGYADATNVAEVDAAVLRLFDEVSGALDLIIDGTDLEYVNSTWIGHLTDWYQRVMAREGKLLLVNLKPQVEDALSTVGLLTIIPHYGNLTEAKLALSEPTAAPVAQNSVAA